MVDEKKIGMTPAVEISLPQAGGTADAPDRHRQRAGYALAFSGAAHEKALPRRQAQRRHHAGHHDGAEKPEGYNVVLSADKLRKYFPRSYTPQKMEETILKLLDAWLRKRQRDQSR